MGMVIEGKWVDDDAQYRTSSSGAFVRPQSVFTHRVTADGSSGFKAEPGRYHLFLAPNCPWAHRTQIFAPMHVIRPRRFCTRPALVHSAEMAESRGRTSC